MTIDEAKAIVYAAYPDALCHHHKPGVNQYSHYWTILTEKVNGRVIGATALTNEETAWRYAAEHILGYK